MINLTEKAREELTPLLREHEGKMLRIHFSGFG